jgi:pimeloyl-ACP methyl ester carboxylesterase
MPPSTLPSGVTSRVIPAVNGLDMHILEAGDPAHPCVLLLHGFPELAYSWRGVMPALAAAGYHVVAPDQRGYGGTTGWDARYDGDVDSFRLSNLVIDQLALLNALGIARVTAVVGHDFGASVAAWAALARPDVFPAVVLMGAPFGGAPGLGTTPADPVHGALAALDRPRKHYQWYYSTRAANADMWASPQGLHAFLRAYYHHKSADWLGNTPFDLGGWNAAALAPLPTYYIMDAGQTMAQTVAVEMPSDAQIEACAWLPDTELRVYSEAFARTGFQGALNWYRCRTEGRNADLRLFAGRTIDVPSAFIAGAQDWGIHQTPGALARMQGGTCTDMRFCDLIAGAGHWVQQEQPAAVTAALLRFLAEV